MLDSAFRALPIRRSVRLRLAEIVGLIASRETFRRSDIMAAVEISMPQASHDIRMIAEVLPDLFSYDHARKTYVVHKDKAAALVQPTAAEMVP